VVHPTCPTSGFTRLKTPGGRRPPLYLTEFGYFNLPRTLRDAPRDPDRRRLNPRRNYWHREVDRGELWRGALRVARRNRVHRMLAYHAVEDDPRAPSRNGVSRIGQWEDYGIFSRQGDVTGQRGYGKSRFNKSYLNPQPKRRVYCVLWYFFNDPARRSNAHECADEDP